MHTHLVCASLPLIVALKHSLQCHHEMVRVQLANGNEGPAAISWQDVLIALLTK
mgnify:CR=1 FL=1